MSERTPETVEAVACSIASRTPPDRHGQLCPVWKRKAEIGACDCWVLRGDRRLARLAIDAVWPLAVAEGRRQEREVAAYAANDAKDLAARYGVEVTG